MIPYGKQNISDADVEAVVAALRSDFLTQGPQIERFEAAIADYCGAGHAVGAANATAALHIACLALGAGPGKRVWTSPNTFLASANCALYCGASVEFVDIDPALYNMSMVALEQKLIEAERKKETPHIVIPVHFSGQSCDMRRIAELKQRFGFHVIEDASHAIGASYDGQRVGACAYSDITVFSFHPVKIITTGEGGMALTNRADLANRMKMLRTHGVTRNPAEMTRTPDGPWYYEQIELGFNYRMTDLQAALGVSQLTRLDAFVARRRELAERYDRLLAELPLKTPGRDPRAESAWHLYVIQLELERISKTHAEVFNGLRAAGIGVNLHYIPVHLQPYYQKLGFQRGAYPAAERYYERAISLPLYFDLSERDQDFIAAALKDLLQ